MGSPHSAMVEDAYKSHSRRHVRALRGALAGLVSVLALGFAGPAPAATYTVLGCQSAGGQLGGWSAFVTRPDLIAAESGCTSGGIGLRVEDRVGNGAQPIYNGDFAEWRFDAPNGTSITAIEASRFLGTMAPT